MAYTLRLENYARTNLLETTQLGLATAKSATPVILQVQSSAGYNVGDWVVIGPLDAEKRELQQVSAIPDATHLTVPSLSYDHSQFEPVISLVGNQLKVYRAASLDSGAVGTTVPPDANFAAVTSPKAIDIDQAYTDFNDNTGTGQVWYKYVYYNSSTGAESALATATATPTGVVHYCSIGEVRQAAGFENNKFMSDAVIAAVRDAAEDEVNGVLVSQYQVPLQLPINGVVRQITKELAAGMLQADQYPLAPAGSAKNGNDRMKNARTELEKIRSSQTKLLNQVGIDESREGPGNQIATGPDTDPMFTVARQF